MKPQLGPEDFDAFYREVHGYSPFPWQRMLAERVTRGEWPACIDLPTASGKTACIDIAIFALACQADRPVEERTAPRRVFFVVDRRIVVDEAFSRADHIARKLAGARDGVLRAVGDRLRSLSGAGESGEPLIATRMRGGVALDDGWVRDPSRPAVITSTVDQVGSRLLFRGYGRSARVAAIDAGLVGNDALFILDEAHCAVPFSQTLAAVQEYRSRRWAEYPVLSPFRAVVMSATPPEDIAADDVFPSGEERARALDAERLARRIKAVKRTELAVARAPRRPRKGEPGLRGDRYSDDPLVLDAADRALRAAAAGPRRIAVMVNRVATARAIWKQLRGETRSEDSPIEADIVLLTGRMRPYDRDRIVRRWENLLAAKEDQEALERPVILITTQCLEVGADFSFDVLITECASLDALRQRFGRLDRLGVAERTEAAILIRPGQARTPQQIEKLEEAGRADDPIYGNALAATWNWLLEHAEADEAGARWIDMGIEGLESHFPTGAEARRHFLGRLSAPAPKAPAMLPAHLDLWVQTSPRPRPDPDITCFLHGRDRGEPEVTVVIRSDLLPVTEFDDEHSRHPWIQAISLLPPTTPEAFSVPLRLVRQWIAAGEADAGALTDVEGTPIGGDDPELAGRRRQVVLWRGRDRSHLTSNPSAVRPGDIVIIPGLEALPEAFGDAVQDEEEHPALDIAEAAFQQARGRAILRVHARTLGHWRDHPRVRDLLDWASKPDRETEPEELDEILRRLADGLPDVEAKPLPTWLKTAARVLAVGCEIAPHPCGGYVLSSRTPISTEAEAEPEQDAFADEDDLLSEAPCPVLLPRHLHDTAVFARVYAERCVPKELVVPIVRSAELHDVGKVDPRFQQVMHGGNELAALAQPEPLAKSAVMPTSQRSRRRARELSGLPRGFRHEALSVQLAERFFELPDDPDHADLVLHLIGTHHGYGRPFMPVVDDANPTPIDVLVGTERITVDAVDRRNWPALHHLSSDTADRFARVVRRYGWWGTALLEAVVRLADWTASANAVHPSARTIAQLVPAGGEQ